MKRKLSITEKKVRAFLILGSIFTLLAAVVAVITQFVVSNDSQDLFGHINLELNQVHYHILLVFLLTRMHISS